MRKIKLLRIIARLNIGGPAIQAALLTKELNNGEFESSLICGNVARDEGDMSYVADCYGIRPLYVRELGRAINLFRDITAFRRILGQMRKLNADIVHTHTAKAGTLGRLAAITAGVPVKIHTFHGNVFQGYFGSLGTRLVIIAERFLARFTDAIIAVSPEQKEEIVGKYRIANGEKCHVVRLGFDLDCFLSGTAQKRGIIRERFGFGEKDILVGIVGRLVPVKNHRMFVDVASCVIEKSDENLRGRIKFVIIGDGEDRGALLEYVRKKQLGDKIFFTGWVQDIARVYADLDIVVLTSRNEGTPVSLIEAMASSRPVISTDVGGVKDVAARAGILVKSGDCEAMAGSVLELAASPDKREELGRRGRDSVKEAYSKKRLVSELEALYRTLLGNSKHKAKVKN